MPEPADFSLIPNVRLERFSREQDILLYVQFEPGASLAWQDLAEWASPRLATYQLPRYFAAAEKFELTPSERIRKHLLPKTVHQAWDRNNLKKELST